MPQYKLLKMKRPDYDAQYWQEIRALYAGGKKLLRDPKLMEQLFPRNLNEELAVYEARRKRAFYFSYLGEIIDGLVAELTKQQVIIKGEPEPDPFYTAFCDDISPPGGTEMSLHELLKRQITEALLLGCSWTLVDLPKPDEQELAPESFISEQDAGLLRAYAVPIDPACVYYWEADENGELEWANICSKQQKRTGIEDSANLIREIYTVYTPEQWDRYVVEYTADGKRPPPKDEQEITPVASGTHSFGRVPLIPLKLPDGLCAGDKLHSAAREGFNLRCMLHHGMHKSASPFLVAKLQAPDALNPVSEDPNRAVNQTVGIGRVWIGAEKDDLNYLSPDTKGFEVIGEQLKALRDEMHRVTHSMAKAAENSPAVHQRSGRSKEIDQSATSIVLAALGQFVREHGINIHEMAGAGRKDPPILWTASGMEDYDADSKEKQIEEATLLETVSIPSATFQQIRLGKLAKVVLGTSASDEQIEQIEEELEANITNEQFGGGIVDTSAADSEPGETAPATTTAVSRPSA